MNQSGEQTILYVLDYYPPYIVGGAEVSTSHIVDIASKQYRTLVLTGKLQPAKWIRNGATIYPEMINVRITNSSLLNKLQYLIGAIYAPIVNSFCLYRIIRDENVDLIHLVPSSYHTIPLIIVALLMGKSVVVDVRNYSLLCPVSRTAGKCSKYFGIKCSDCLMVSYKIDSKILKLLKPLVVIYELLLFNFYVFLLRRIVRNDSMSIFVANSEYVRKELIAGGFPSERIRVIYNIADRYEKLKENRLNRIIFAGSLEKSKGVWDAIKGFELRRKKEYTLEIAGEGKEKDDILAYIKNRGINNIVLIGKISHESVIDLYATSKIILAPSVWNEPFGRFILEAISTKTPLITTRTGGTPEGIINMKTGILVEAGRPDQICDAINNLTEDEELYARIQSSLDSEREKYSAEKIGKKRMELYSQLLKRN
ncbi:MAG: glycosyltransferase [Candidatus Moraniibacteriota bacterium]